MREKKSNKALKMLLRKQKAIMAKVFGRKRKSVSLQEIVPNLSLLRKMAKRNLVQRRKKRRKRLRKRKNSNRE